ncbi:MAG TPA: glycosyltransferase, partial [Verrucomicrobiae bacterium]|nr:glycosyltransferase [Verrucomicrobiae bacterium]
MNGILGGLALLSSLLLIWQWLVGRRFPLHQRQPASSFQPGITLLKPLKGCDETTQDCLRSWLDQRYQGPVQIIFAVASAEDPVCKSVRNLLDSFPDANAQLLICGPLAGANLKVSKLLEAERLAVHDFVVVSDADVKVPPDFLQNAVLPLQQPEVGLVNCFYCFANPTTLAMRWEA